MSCLSGKSVSKGNPAPRCCLPRLASRLNSANPSDVPRRRTKSAESRHQRPVLHRILHDASHRLLSASLSAFLEREAESCRHRAAIQPPGPILQPVNEEQILSPAQRRLWNGRRESAIRTVVDLVGCERMAASLVENEADSESFLSDGREGRSRIADGTVARVGARPHRRRTGDLHFDRIAFHL